MPSDHIARKRLIAAVRSLDRRRQLISACALDEIDTQILRLHLLEFKPFGYIADAVGLSPSQTGRRFNRALKALVWLLDKK